jgi:hypothetical protein
LSQYILEQLCLVLKGDFGNLISQTCDGTAVVSGEKGGVQTVITEIHIKNAHFIHCYAHQLNLIMEKAASQNTEVRIFLAVYQEYQPSSHDLHSAYLCFTAFPKEFQEVPVPDGILTTES